MSPKPKRSDYPPSSAGELAHLGAIAAWQRERGRSALMDDAEVFHPDEAGTIAPKTRGKRKAGEGEDPEEPTFEHLKIPRIIGDKLRWVGIGLPDDSPVTPLGVQGGTFWFLNPHGELIGLDAGKFGQSHIQGLYAPKLDWLYRAFPQFNQQGKWKGFQAQYAQAALMGTAGAKGIFDARDKVRGLGCWKGDDGQLVQHLGDRILDGTKEHKPGEIGGYVYPGRPPLARPTRAGLEAARTVQKRVQTWRWVRKEVDARLFMGWVGCAILGAALRWRPMTFLIGDAGTGKSSLQDELKMLLPGRLVSTVDASPAALRQVLNQDAVADSFDEIEADMLNDQAQQVMKLARVAASGGTVYRGGKDHTHAEFQMRGCFAFSAILPPSMRQQDMQRFAFLRLMPLGDAKPPVALTPAEAREMGAGLVGRITERWAEWEPMLASYKTALEAQGHAKRGAEQFGALLAAADLLLEEDSPGADRLEYWASLLKRDGLYEYENSEPTWLKAWRHLLNAQPEVWRQDAFPTVAEVLRTYLMAVKLANGEVKKKAHDKLTRAGLAVVSPHRSGRQFLAIPGNHQAIAQIYSQTDMRAHGGEGVWTNALRGAQMIDADNPDGVYYVEKVPRLQRVRCTLYNLDAVVDLAGVPTPIFEREIDDNDSVDGPAEREPGQEG